MIRHQLAFLSRVQCPHCPQAWRHPRGPECLSVHADTTFKHFERDHGAALRLLPRAYATLVSTAFKRNMVADSEPYSPLAAYAGSAVAAINDSYVWISKVLPV